MDQTFDFPPIDDFTEECNYNIDSFDCKGNSNFIVMPSTSLYSHLSAKGYSLYNRMPRSINEHHFLYSFKTNLNKERKAQIVSTYHSTYGKNTWVFMAVSDGKKNEYYALTFKVNMDLSGLNTGIKEIYNQTIKNGILSSIVRYKFKSNIKPCKL